MSLILKSEFTKTLLRTFMQACGPDLIEDICLAGASNARILSPTAIRIVKTDLIPLSLRLLQYDSLMNHDTLFYLKVAIAPHKHLPSEILLEIFKYFRPTSRVKGLRGFKIPGNTQQGCMFLRQICRRWRVVAIDCLPLWSTVMLGVDFPASSPKFTRGSQILRNIWEARVAFAQTIISSKGGINLAIDAGLGFDLSLAPYALNQLVKPLATRISTLILTAPFTSCLDLLRMDGSQFNSLRRLELDISRVWEGPQGTFETAQCRHMERTMLMHAPFLQRISASRWNILLNAVPPESLPWARLTNFTLRHPIEPKMATADRQLPEAISYQQLLPALTQAANLTTFVVAPGLGPRFKSWDIEPIVLPNLRFLALEAAGCKDWEFFGSITAGPKLWFLGASCTDYNGLEAIPFTKITSFIERSSCQQSLLSFEISPPQHTINPFYEVDSGFLEGIGQLMPNLTTLRIPMALDETDFDQIGQGSLLRNLHTLWCRFSGHPMCIIASLETRLDVDIATSFGCHQLLDVRCFDDECYAYSFDLEELTADVSSQYGVNLELHPLAYDTEIFL